MGKDKVYVHKYANGMTLVVEPMADVSSAAFAFLVPAGVGYDPQGRTGAATVLHDLLFRGAGALDNRALNEALDGLGMHRQGSVSDEHAGFAGALISDNLLRALEIHADVLQRPALEADQFELCRQLALQGLDSLDDDPRHKISLSAQEHFLPAPYGRPGCGKRDDLTALTHAEVKGVFGERFSPAGTILAAAGRVDFEQIKAAVEDGFGGWQGKAEVLGREGKCQTGMFHGANKGAQVHVGVIQARIVVIPWFQVYQYFHDGFFLN